MPFEYCAAQGTVSIQTNPSHSRVAEPALTGFTVQTNSTNQGPSVMNVNMNILEGAIQKGGIAGVRVDLPIQPPGQPSVFTQEASYFFYQADLSVWPLLTETCDNGVLSRMNTKLAWRICGMLADGRAAS